jgi:tRNA 2-thiocytidine biosynthesis protein TtcA
LARQRIKRLVNELAQENPKIPSNILHALGHVKPSQLMDKQLWNFKGLEAQRDNGEMTFDLAEKGDQEIAFPDPFHDLREVV